MEFTKRRYERLDSIHLCGRHLFRLVRDSNSEWKASFGFFDQAPSRSAKNDPVCVFKHPASGEIYFFLSPVVAADVESRFYSLENSAASEVDAPALDPFTVSVYGFLRVSRPECSTLMGEINGAFSRFTLGLG